MAAPFPSGSRAGTLAGMGPRVVVIGGGIGGLTAAVAFARRGIRAEIYEQAPELREVGAGVGLWPNAFRALAPLGLAEQVRGLTPRPKGFGFRRTDGKWLLYQPMDVAEKRWGTSFVSVHRAELQQLLASQVDRAALHLGHRCSGFAQEKGRILVRFDGGGEVEADLLVGADGVHSVVRSQLLGPARLSYRGYRVARGLTEAGSVPLPADAWETWGRGARFGLGPISGERLIWYACWNARLGADGDDHTKERMLERFGAWLDPIPDVIEATQDFSLCNDIYDSWPTRSWAKGPIALVGDAVHPMTPDLAQGACQAIVDGATLASCIAEATDVGTGLRAYQKRRAGNAALTTLTARFSASIGQLKGRRTSALRDFAFGALPPWFQLRQLDLIVGRA
jgi:2-polyprenyl-6-methoxyphenol hydroxylase-like FAD-dependent oxidoreductase